MGTEEMNVDIWIILWIGDGDTILEGVSGSRESFVSAELH